MANPWDNDPIIAPPVNAQSPANPAAPWEQQDEVVIPAQQAGGAALPQESYDPTEGMSTVDKLLAGIGHRYISAEQGGRQFLTDAAGSWGRGTASLMQALGGEQAANMLNEHVVQPLERASQQQRAEVAEERRLAQPLLDTKAGTLGDFLGSIALSAPLWGIGVAAKGAGAARAIGQAALGGAAQGLIEPVAQDGERLHNSELGAAFGGGLGALGRGAISLGENLLPSNATARGLNFFNNRANKDAFANEGEALAQRTGIDLTPGMVSGSRAQTGAENMARQSLFSADNAFKADEKIGNQAIAHVNSVMDRITPDSASAQTIGDRLQRTVRDAVEKIGTSREQTAARQFGAIRNMVGDTPIVDYNNTKKVLEDIIGEYTDVVGADAGRIRNQATALLNQINEKAAYSLDAARRARGSYGRAARGSENIFSDVAPDVNRTIAKRLYGAMSDDLDAAGTKLDEVAGFGKNMPVPEGVQAQRPSEMLKQANDDYRRHSQLLKAVEMSPLKRLLGDQINVDDFMTMNTLAPEAVVARVNSMKPSEVGFVRDFMEKNAPDTWQQYKRMLVEDALAAAQSAPGSAGAKTLPYNAPGFIRALGGDKPDKVEKLKAIFNPNEMREIMDAMQAARRMGDKFGTNFSGTGPYNEMASAIKDFSLRGLSTTASTAFGFNKVAKMMLNSDGRKALIELSRLPPGTKKANDVAAYLAGVTAASHNSNQPLEIDFEITPEGDLVAPASK